MRVNESILDDGRNDKNNRNEIVELEWFKNRNRNQTRYSDHIPRDSGQSVLATGKVLPTRRDEKEHLPEGNCEHGEINPCLSDNQQSDQDGDYGGESDSENHS